MERYRSGHNELHSKCSVPFGTVGSNPTLSAIQPPFQGGFFITFYIATSMPGKTLLLLFTSQYNDFIILLHYIAFTAAIRCPGSFIRSPDTDLRKEK